MARCTYNIGDLVKVVPDGEYYPRAGVITAIDWDNPRNPHPVTVAVRGTTNKPALTDKFAFGELRPC